MEHSLENFHEIAIHPVVPVVSSTPRAVKDTTTRQYEETKLSITAADLRRRAAEINSLNERTRRASIHPSQRVKPLDQQILELMATIPPMLRQRPWNIGELVARLQGIYQERPSCQHVGRALRRLGWSRQRRWEKGFDGARVWIPSQQAD
jgi:hypothetical protein